MSRRVIGPFNRVEGDLEVKIEITDNQVSNAWVTSPLYRGYEQILHGKAPQDALVYVPRICGICSVSQSVAAATALAAAQGVKPTLNGQLATNLILATENLADHLTHFYLFFMPDFARSVYKQRSWFKDTEQRFKAPNKDIPSGTAATELLPQRAQLMHMMGWLAGKWPHSLAIQPGGTTRAIQPQERTRMMGVLFGLRQFLQRALFGDTLESIVELTDASALNSWQQQRSPLASDFSRFLHIADDLKLEQLGRASDRFMSFGAYPTEETHLFPGGTWQNGEPSALDQSQIAEDLSHSWMQNPTQPLHPFDGITLPDSDPNQSNGYSWCKAPRLGGEVIEVGAISRQLLAGHPLITQLVKAHGGNVKNRVIARLIESARLVIAMEEWTKALIPKQPFCNHGDLPKEGQAMGLIEAARGSLGHWLNFSKGRITNYQIIAPPTWNFSPRDHSGVARPLEQALIGAPLQDGEKDPVAVQHIVRSFDPCMVCTVH